MPDLDPDRVFIPASLTPGLDAAIPPCIAAADNPARGLDLKWWLIGSLGSRMTLQLVHEWETGGETRTPTITADDAGEMRAAIRKRERTS